MKHQKLIMRLVFVAALLAMTAQTAWAETVTLTSGTGAVTLNNGDVLTGTGGADTHVIIADGATVTLSGVTIHPNCGTDHNKDQNGCKWAGISCAGTATIILAENTTNTVKGFCHHHPGIFVPSGSTLTIQGSGTLNASNGEGPNGKSYAAGIGGGYKFNCGDIVIRSGNITATGGSDAAGIGSGEEDSACGNIVISGGIVNATGGYGAAGIGSGANYSSSYGTITISGGTVTATGGDYAAGIGAGTGSQYGTQSQNGDIQITGGSVTATGGTYGAGIGSAGYGSSSKSNCGNITIVSGTIKSTKGTSAPNSIGAGLYGTCGTVTVGGVVGAKTDNFDQTIVGDTYTVSFNANGGTGDMSNQTIYRGIVTPLTRNTFTRDGYVFIGWSETAGGDVAYPDCKKVTDLAEKNGTKTLYAKWMSTSDILSGFQVDAEYAQTEAGFYYVNMPADLSSISVNINAPKYYTFKIYDNGGKDGDYYCSNDYTQSATFTVPEGYKIGLNGTITINKEEVYDYLRVYDGSSSSATRLYIYNFNTHYVNTSSTSNSITLEFVEGTVNSGTHPDKGFDITATIVPVNYTVSFKANATEGISGSMEDQTFTYGEGAKALTANAYTRTGYTFAGWATSADGNVVYADGAEVSNLATTDGTVIKLFAKWTLIEYTITYNGVDEATFATANPTTYTIESAAITLNNPSKDGYTFAGWTGTGLGAATTSVTIATGNYGDRDYTATWKKLLTNGITVDAIADQTWKDGNAIEPTALVVVKDGETVITDQCDITFSNNTNVGTATVTITAKAESTGYAGSTTATFTITPKAIGTYGAIAVTEDQNGKTATIDASLEATIEISSDIEVNQVALQRSFTENQPATVMLPFSLSDGQTVSGGSFYKFSGVVKDGDIWKAQFTEAATLKANTPYLFNPSADGNMTFDLNNGIVTLNTTTTGESGNTTTNWEFHGTYQKVMWNGNTGGNTDPSDLDKTYGFAKGNGTTIAAGQFVHFAAGAWLKPMRCYLVYNGSTEGGTFHNARRMTRGTSASEELPQTITVVLLSSNGGTTSVGTINALTGEISFDGWYTMDGRKLEGKPTKKGLYINNGRKIVIK